jgi:hypothetical protein
MKVTFRKSDIFSRIFSIFQDRQTDRQIFYPTYSNLTVPPPESFRFSIHSHHQGQKSAKRYACLCGKEGL